MFCKRPGTSGISGQLYETKLISLLYLRAFHNDAIEEFQLASNVDNIGAFDDICFRAKVEGRDKPVAVFIQARHRRSTIKIDLATYFESYLRIRQRFKTYNKDDVLFKGTFDETECLFVIYANAKVVSGYESVLSDVSLTLHRLIDTGGIVQQLCGSETIIEYFHLIILKDDLTSLAARLAEFLMNEDRPEQMLHDELLLRYHVILAQKVLEVSKIQPEGHRIASFRYDFFHTNEDHLQVFKKRLFIEILKRRKIKPADVDKLLSECSADPTDATKLSKVIGTVVSYFNGRLECNIRYMKDVRPQLDTYVSRGTVNKATELAARDILLPRQFKVPAAFGNKDLTMRGSDKKIEQRLNHLASRIIDLLDKCEASKMVTIDESLGSGFLQLNGGLAGAIGNIFVLDDNTKLMKITDNEESLENLAKRLYELLLSNDKIHNIHEYRFRIKVNEFPKLSFDFNAYEENLATDFLNKLLFYSNQADGEDLENIIKSEIEDYQSDQPSYYQVKTDVIFSMFHDEIQKWWHSQSGIYLTRESDLFKRVLSFINNGTLLKVINIMYKNKISQYKYTFTEDAVRSLNLQDQHSSSVIVAENTVLTALKVMQYLEKKQHVVLDLEYIVNLGGNDRRALCTELEHINENVVLIFVCDNMHHSVNAKKTLEHIAKVIENKKHIIITSQTSIEVLQYFPMVESVIHDNKLSLVDVSEDSQERILETATATFGLVEMSLAELLKGWPMGGFSPQGDAGGSAAATSAAGETEKSLALV